MVVRPDMFPQEHEEPEAKTVPGQIVEDLVDRISLGTLVGTAGKIVDRFFDNDTNKD